MFGRARALIAKGDRLANKADLTLDFAKALLDDLQDGVAVTVHVNDGAAHKILSHFFKGKGGTLPITVAVDPTYDTLPPKVARFVGGPYDGKQYTVSEGTRALTLEGGADYVWNGHTFNYVE